MPELCQNKGKTAAGWVVYAPLDWGMGHTTRSIPIIRELLQENYNIIIACKSSQKKILQAEFPQLVFKELQGYSITYGRNGWFTTLKIIFQIPKILTNVKYENRWLDQLVAETRPDIIISDNRYGFYNKNVKSILITHQLKIQSGLGNWIDKQIQKRLYRILLRFNHCWVPDFEQLSQNLAGKLSHPQQPCPIPVTYIGALSRLRPCTTETKKDILLCLLSGPEPQRSILEQKIISEAGTVNKQIILVRGITEPKPIPSLPSNCNVIDYLGANELNDYLCSASLVISRSGYTSVMDFARIGCQSVLIPTPGQAEQEYLAEHLESIQFAPYIQQKDFSLLTALSKASAFQYMPFTADMEQYKKMIVTSIEALKG